jgi:hypothetical protein
MGTAARDARERRTPHGATVAMRPAARRAARRD